MKLVLIPQGASFFSMSKLNSKRESFSTDSEKEIGTPQAASAGSVSESDLQALYVIDSELPLTLQLV